MSKSALDEMLVIQFSDDRDPAGSMLVTSPVRHIYCGHADSIQT